MDSPLTKFRSTLNLAAPISSFIQGYKVSLVPILMRKSRRYELAKVSLVLVP
jgi:hypothetical protein